MDEPLVRPKTLYPSAFRKAEFVTEVACATTSKDINRVYGMNNSARWPRFGTREKNATVDDLIRLFGAPPTHATYFLMGATAREPETKTLEKLHWNGNVEMFGAVTIDKRGEMRFSISFDKLNTTLEQRLTMKRDYDSQKLVNEPFATFLSNPSLVEVKKHYISKNTDDCGKPTVTVTAWSLIDALKILLAFLDQDVKDANQHYLALQKEPLSVAQLCRRIAPLLTL